MADWGDLRVGYAACSPDLTAPGDRRRFAFWARHRGVDVVPADLGGSYDLVVLSGRADISSWSRRRAVPMIFDLVNSYLAPSRSIDTVFRGPAKFLTGEFRRPVLDYRSAVRRMCEAANAVVCTTLEQSSDIRPLNGNVHVILDDHSELPVAAKDEYGLSPDGALHVMWEGLPYTLGPLKTITPVLEQLETARPVTLHLVTAPTYSPWLGRFGRRSAAEFASRVHHRSVIHPWSVPTLAEVASRCDIAVIPLDLDNPMSRGKPENKLLGLWRLGLPTIASASPANRRAMAGAGIDLACVSPDDWVAAFDALLASRSDREAAARKGAAYAERVHGADALLHKWDSAVASALGERAGLG